MTLPRESERVCCDPPGQCHRCRPDPVAELERALAKETERANRNRASYRAMLHARDDARTLAAAWREEADLLLRAIETGDRQATAAECYRAFRDGMKGRMDAQR